MSALAQVRLVRVRSVRRTRLVLSFLALLAAVLFLVDVTLGSCTVTLPDLVRILRGDLVPGASFVVLQDKLPRAVVALLAGTAFGMSGAVFQTLLRNPLASPDIIGVSAGASAAAVGGIVVLGLTGPAVSVAALAGAFTVAVTVHLLARHANAAGPRLVLMGIGVAAMLQSCTSYLLTRSDITTTAGAFVWLTGSLGASSWPRVVWLLVGLAVMAPLLLLGSVHLRGLELGTDVANGLGVPVERSRVVLLLVAVCLAAVATAGAGPLAFVAFVSGPVARRLLRGQSSLACAGLVGAVVVLGAEYVAVNLVPGVALPVGVVTGALGAPFLIWLLVAANRGGRGG